MVKGGCKRNLKGQKRLCFPEQSYQETNRVYHTLIQHKLPHLNFDFRITTRAFKMGSFVGVLRSDRRSKAIVTQVRQENLRLQARVERLSLEATQLRSEMINLLKEKQMDQFDHAADHEGGTGASTLRFNSPASVNGKYK